MPKFSSKICFSNSAASALSCVCCAKESRLICSARRPGLASATMFPCASSSADVPYSSSITAFCAFRWSSDKPVVCAKSATLCAFSSSRICFSNSSRSFALTASCAFACNISASNRRCSESERKSNSSALGPDAPREPPPARPALDALGLVVGGGVASFVGGGVASFVGGGFITPSGRVERSLMLARSCLMSASCWAIFSLSDLPPAMSNLLRTPPNALNCPATTRLRDLFNEV